MNLHKKILLAEAPLAHCVWRLSVLFPSSSSRSLGSHSQTILKDNYRSVLAAQRMKEAIERIGQRRAFHSRR